MPVKWEDFVSTMRRTRKVPYGPFRSFHVLEDVKERLDKYDISLEIVNVYRDGKKCIYGVPSVSYKELVSRVLSSLNCNQFKVEKVLRLPSLFPATVIVVKCEARNPTGIKMAINRVCCKPQYTFAAITSERSVFV